MKYKISILTIGDEICIGQVTNTNASWIASQCTKLGADIIRHVSVGDVMTEMLEEVDRLLKISDFVIVTGGLGPTHDDITKPCLATFFGDELVFNQDAYDNLEYFLSLRKIRMTEKNKSMAYLPSKCKLLFNRNGTAPGMLFENCGTFCLVSLPGVPREMMSIMEDHVLPLIAKIIEEKNADVLLFKTLQTSGIPESILAEKIGDVSDFLGDGTLAFLPSYKGVRLRIGVSDQNFKLAELKLEKIENHIRDKAGSYIYGVGDDSLVSVIGHLLRDGGHTLSVAESCTGGLLGAEFTKISGSSDYFLGGAIVYSNDLKINILNVNPLTIETFGAVSEQTATELAENANKKFNTDYSLSITGIAGPTGGTEEKPVGTVWIGMATPDKTITKKFQFGNDREINRERAVGTALNMLYKELTGQQI